MRPNVAVYIIATVSKMIRSRGFGNFLARITANTLGIFGKVQVTNAKTEDFNSKVQHLKCSGRVLRNFESYRRRILFYRGKLEMIDMKIYPQKKLKNLFFLCAPLFSVRSRGDCISGQDEVITCH